VIPLLHLTIFISAIFCLFAARRLYSSFRRTRNINIGNFFKVFLTLTLYFSFVSLPGILADPTWIQISYIFSYIFLFFSPIWFLKATFNMFRFPWGKYIIIIVLVMIIVTIFLNIFFSFPAQIQTFNHKFYHWSEGTPSWLGIFNGILIGILALGSSFLFFFGGLRSKEKLIRFRALLIGGGLDLLVVSALLAYTTAALLKGVMRWSAGMAASLLTLPGLILILVGIYYRGQEKEGSA